MISASFAPHVRADTRLLILGSLPGRASLAARQYYAHPRNLFWALLGQVLEEDITSLPYEARLDRLASRGIGLWDVVQSAERAGSLDAAIRNPAANDLQALVAGLPRLRTIAFNGATAHRIGQRLLAGHGQRLVPLPSSSPAYAAMPFDAKRDAWIALRAFLQSAES